MQRWSLALFVSLTFALLSVRGQDFDLGDALDTTDTTAKKPVLPTAKPDMDDHGKTQTEPHPNPGSPDKTGGGTFQDSDLFGGEMPPEKPGGRADNPAGGDDSKPQQDAEASQGVIPGIISAVVVAIVGAVSSFIAYQKKKLCFKQSDQENVNMENQQGVHAEPPVQRTLLQK
uniref:CD99 molecule (Xg blood group) n=1 Tax=Sphenodon punctatus TaxID=8508 RepID=A0A8D0HCF8_SPHPU